jgi:soluble lytic murein transglycosylase
VSQAFGVAALLWVLVAAGPERLSVEDPHAPVRAALARGDAEAALLLLGEREGLPPPLVSAPGLYGRALELRGEEERACAVYEADAKDRPERGEAALLRLARCRAGLGQVAAALAAFQGALTGSLLGDDVLVLDEALRTLTGLGARAEALAMLGPTRLLEAPVEPKDTLRREAHGRLLQALVRSGSEAQREAALGLLYTALGETPAATEALKLPVAQALSSHKDRALALARAEVLTQRHDNAGVFETLARHQPKPSEVGDEDCELRLMWGKAARKLRRYQNARAALDVVATRCSGESQRRARYLAAQVAYYQSSSEGLLALETFANAYPQDPLTDDVLFWRAELLERAGRSDEAKAGYRQVVDDFADGDMREDARFNLALLLAKDGDGDGARAVLDEIARTAKTRAVMERDRALYWRARLSLFPDPYKLLPTADEARRKEGHDALVALARARPASFYGHLARQLALAFAQEAGRDAVALKASLDNDRALSRRSLAAAVQVPVPPALGEEPRFALAVAFASGGYDDVALLLLTSLGTGAAQSDDARTALTLLYTQLGALAESHQVMRFTGHALPNGKPTEGSLLTWHLAFPPAYADALGAGARAVERVPTTLLMGLAREESAFDADVVSWAGAVGLCQLMPPTAREEAQLLKLPAPSIEALREPFLNARLGANHLARRMNLLSHPLLAIAAYNAGPGNLAKWRKDDAPKPIDAWVESIPVEQTRFYVKKVTGSWVVYEALDGDVDHVRFPLVLP